MDPISTIQSVAGVIKLLWEVSEKMKENKAECQKLCNHTESILNTIRMKRMGKVSFEMQLCLAKLESTLRDVAAIGEQLSNSSLLRRTLWRHQISQKIQDAYGIIEKAMQEFNFVTLVEFNRMQGESDEARRVDSMRALETFNELLRNDQDVISQLQIQSQEMQEAMLSIQKYIADLPQSVERHFLENGLFAIQRRSGPAKVLLDEFLITSLDVMIFHERKLGEGGFAAVYEGDWHGTQVAVKILQKGVPASAFQQEVNIWKKLRHPHILDFYGASSIADPPFMVCAHKSNGDVIHYLRRHPNADRCRLLSQAVQGLAYLHRHSIVHGDLKGTNILVDSKGVACLSDFGLSRVKNQTTTIRQPSTAPSVGTARWMSPEQMTIGMTNKRTDVYSFGMTMYEVFTGRPPFASTPDSFLLSVVCDRRYRPEQPDEPEIVAYGLTDEMWSNIITKTWAHEPRDRCTATELTEALVRFCDARQSAVSASHTIQQDLQNQSLTSLKKRRISNVALAQSREKYRNKLSQLTSQLALATELHGAGVTGSTALSFMSSPHPALLTPLAKLFQAQRLHQYSEPPMPSMFQPVIPPLPRGHKIALHTSNNRSKDLTPSTLNVRTHSSVDLQQQRFAPTITVEDPSDPKSDSSEVEGPIYGRDAISPNSDAISLLPVISNHNRQSDVSSGNYYDSIGTLPRNRGSPTYSTRSAVVEGSQASAPRDLFSFAIPVAW